METTIGLQELVSAGTRVDQVRNLVHPNEPRVSPRVFLESLNGLGVFLKWS